jgi:hypothetical protein
MCGAVRYELKSEPLEAGWCHCRTCQLFSGAPAMAFFGVPAGDFSWTRGEPRWIRSSNFASRGFCADCGSSLQVRTDFQPDTVDVTITTLDEPDAIRPEFHIFFGSKVGWFEPGDNLPRHDRFRPNTRGLEGTEPPDNSSLSGGGGRGGSA